MSSDSRTEGRRSKGDSFRENMRSLAQQLSELEQLRIEVRKAELRNEMRATGPRRRVTSVRPTSGSRPRSRVV